jgi:hypothetical protein
VKFRLLLALLLCGSGVPAMDKTADECRLQVDLTDGSRLSGTTTMAKLPISTAVGALQLPLAALRELEFKPTGGQAICRLRNGDVLSGQADWQALPLKTPFGQFSIALKYIRKIAVTASGSGALPPGEGPLAFGGLNWTPQRRAFEIQNDRLVVLPQPRPGFEYGHGAHGRAGLAVSNIGSETWRDYRLEFTLGLAPADPAFDPYGLRNASPKFLLRFHVVSHPENWNERDANFYDLNLGSDGTWALGCVYHFVCDQPMGHGHVSYDGSREVARGSCLQLKAEGSRAIFEVQGQHIRLWLDDTLVVDASDDKMGEPINGVTLDHGGIGLGWDFEFLGWIADFKAQKL